MYCFRRAGLRADRPVPEAAKQAAVPGPDNTVPEDGDPVPDWDAWGLVLINNPAASTNCVYQCALYLQLSEYWVVLDYTKWRLWLDQVMP